MLDPVVARQATVVKGYSGAAGAENAAITQVSLDINAEIGPAPSASLTPTERGALGRPRDIPPRSEAGPVRDSGYTDATATLPPVLAAFHARGNMELPLNKPKQKKLPKPYAQPVLEDAFTREIPEGHEGLVFTAVVFSA